MSELINPQAELILRQTILPDLEKGRKDFDRPHTEAVVFWMKTLLGLLSNPELDTQVLITAAYAHDWGYIGLFDGLNSDDLLTIRKMKPVHMERGAKKIEELVRLKLSTLFSEDQITRCAHLVLVHDLVETLKDEDELLLMECDTLGMIDVNRVKPTFTKESNSLFMEREIKSRRIPLFLHTQAKDFAQKLALARLQFYD